MLVEITGSLGDKFACKNSENWGANLARIVEAVGHGGMKPAGRVAVGLRSDSLGDRSWSFVDAGAAAAVGMESVYRVVCQTDAKGRGASSAVVWLRAGKAPPAPAALEAVPGPDGIRLAARPTEGTPEDAAWRFYRLELTPGVELTGPGRPQTPQPSAEPVLLDSAARQGGDYEYCASAVARFGSSVRMLLRESEGPSEPLEALALRGASMGAAFGGSSQTLFGSSGPGTLLGKMTTGVAVVFMLTSLWLAYFAVHKGSSVMQGATPAPIEQTAPAPAVPPDPAPEKNRVPVLTKAHEQANKTAYRMPKWWNLVDTLS